jgi:hypothetical protein
MPSITFFPSERRILFFQKKIKQLNVQFIEAIVELQSHARFAFRDNAVPFEVILSPIYTKTGMDSTTRQADVSKQHDIFFKENILSFISGDVLFIR